MAKEMNVLLIMNDALRPDRMGCYGYPRCTTPNIDALARNGVRFDKPVAVSTHTIPPVYSMITGLSTIRHGLMSSEDYAALKGIGPSEWRRTPLHGLREHGYRVEGELVMRWNCLGFERDIEDIEGYFKKHRGEEWFFMAEPYSTHLPYNPPEEYYELFLDDGFSPDQAGLDRLELVRTHMILHPPGVISAAESGREDHIGEGDDAHRRTVATVEFRPEDRPGVNALYDGEVRVFDDLVGRYVASLEDLGILDDTLIIITSDHGEELLERGHIGHTSCNLKGTLYDECLLVPLIMHCPSSLPSGTVVKNQISQIDIMPTILDMLALDVDCEMDGASVLPLIREPATGFREEAYAETIPAGWQALDDDHRRIWCIRTAEWKLIMHTDNEPSFRRYELYNLNEDPGETVNLFPLENRMVSELKSKLDNRVEMKARQTVHDP